MGQLVKLMNSIELYPGEMIQVRDRARYNYTLKYESIIGGVVNFKQMGRNTSKIISCELENVADFIHSQFRKVDKVLKF